MKVKKKISKRNRTLYSKRSIKYLVIHYVGAVSSAKDNAKYFYSVYRGASAHYFVDDSSIWQSVEDKNAAWHCGGGLQGSGGHSFYKKCTNANSLGIEMCCKKKEGKLYITNDALKNTAELVQYLQKKYDIPDSRVIRHYDVTGKNCPAPYLDSDKWKAAKKILVGNAVMEADKPSKQENGKLAVDGSWGKDCTRKSQKVFKTEQDGVVSNQPVSNKKYLPNAYTGSWEFTGNCKGGSALIRAIQKMVGSEQDGWCGKGTVKAMQKFLKKGGFYTGDIDGSMGSATVKAWQKYINGRL